MPASPLHPFITWFGVDEAAIQRVLSAAMDRGADFADLYFQHVRSTSLSLEDGIVSRANTGVEQGVGVRAVTGDQVGYAFSENLDLDSMLTAASTAATIADDTARVPPQKVDLVDVPDYYPVDRSWEEVGAEERLPLLQKAEAMAREMEEAVENVTVYWSDSDERVLIATSDGALCADRRPMGTLNCGITALKNGVRQSHGSNLSRRRGIDAFGDESIREVVREAVDRTMILFEAQRPPAGEMPVVLAAGASGILLHEAIGHGLEADFNRKGTSIYSTLLNQPVPPTSSPSSTTVACPATAAPSTSTTRAHRPSVQP